ncbi:DNA polymerase subunit Cdc27 [Purpureocillium lavendulum]|uniref:DNA polymerase subunit Cdc27 n=1 Tax=Purpureocillium lavendulum TaxID=1247861 RepID=A0AB34FW44_9HYPO|nr:DNA polymerase subunit Cdc27 [Purpureocillium lavendulum]
MATFSPIPSYLFGTAFLGLSLSAILAPRREYARFGLPLENTTTTATTAATTSDKKLFSHSGGNHDDEDTSFASPLMYLKGIRELTYGLALVALQRQGNEPAVTTLVGVLAFAAIGDGFVIWAHGGPRLRAKAWGHWVPGLGFLAWAFWRWSRQ